MCLNLLPFTKRGSGVMHIPIYGSAESAVDGIDCLFAFPAFSRRGEERYHVLQFIIDNIYSEGKGHPRFNFLWIENPQEFGR